MIDVRPVRPEDRTLLLELLRGLSPETLHRRFFSAPKVDDRLVDMVAHPSECCSEALVAVAGAEVVGVASYDRLPHDPVAAEVAVLVADRWQRHGVGTLLTRHLRRAALERGIDRFVATMLPDNDAVLGLVHRSRPAARLSRDGRELAMELPLRRASTAA